ncbi:hypothetical protein KDA23_04815 [Candidatus Saccharibacteria bacterium]|nr:hypothetical protein [Candidatus Saccharibacteria bacterium]
MRLRDQSGAINALLLPLIAVVLLMVIALSFAFWAYQGRQDYKNNSDAKVAAAVDVAKQQEAASKEKEFAERSKSPYKTYVGPSAYGSVSVVYPRTWSAYVRDSLNQSPFVDGYFSPGVVPDTQDDNSSYALRVQVVQESYSDVMEIFRGRTSGEASVKVQPYRLPKVKSIVGSKVTGAIEDNKQGTMIVLPVRDKTLKIWTESNSYTNDLNKIILANLTFSP